jgi:hypothetical protein
MLDIIQSQAFSGFLSFVLTTVITASAGFVIAFIKQKIGTEKFNRFYGIAYRAVLEAEQLYQGTKMGATRKNFVLNKVYSELRQFLSEDQIKSLIESAVGAMNLIKQKNSLPDVTSEHLHGLSDLISEVAPDTVSEPSEVSTPESTDNNQEDTSIKPVEEVQEQPVEKVQEQPETQPQPDITQTVQDILVLAKQILEQTAKVTASVNATNSVDSSASVVSQPNLIDGVSPVITPR